jgi:pyrroloquinoline quinone biosynthesis protein B
VQVRILGSAAGGGVPQWNCACRICRGCRDGSLPVRPRSQASAAVSADGRHWFLLHASPDVREQIERCPALHPVSGRRSPIAGVLLGNGDLDACLGLLSLRESQPLTVYTSAAIASGFVEGNRFARTLARFDGQLRWRTLELGAPTVLTVDGEPSGLTVTAFAVPGKQPLHLVGTQPPSDGDTLALCIEEPARGRTLVWAPSVRGPSSTLSELLQRCDCALFDGTFWRDDELGRIAAGAPLARAMGHWPLGGPDGSLQLLAAMPARRILVHVNNTNPVLVEDSAEHALMRALGVELAHDGLEVQI